MYSTWPRFVKILYLSYLCVKFQASNRIFTLHFDQFPSSPNYVRGVICFSSRLHKSICLDFQIMLVPIDSMIRSAKSGYECGLIDDMKDNPNSFHGHCQRSLKTKQGVSNVVEGSGRLNETEGEAAATLNTYYHLVFTRDDGSARFLSSAQ